MSDSSPTGYGNRIRRALAGGRDLYEQFDWPMIGITGPIVTYLVNLFENGVPYLGHYLDSAPTSSVVALVGKIAKGMGPESIQRPVTGVNAVIMGYALLKAATNGAPLYSDIPLLLLAADMGINGGVIEGAGQVIDWVKTGGRGARGKLDEYRQRRAIDGDEADSDGHAFDEYEFDWPEEELPEEELDYDN